jgi:hypothetical protein
MFSTSLLREKEENIPENACLHLFVYVAKKAIIPYAYPCAAFVVYPTIHACFEPREPGFSVHVDGVTKISIRG